MITLLDYGAGNVRSVINAIESLGERVKVAAGAEDITAAEKLVFPGVGAFGSMMQILESKRYISPLKHFLLSGRPFLGICLGMHALFEASEEADGVPGLGVFQGRVKRFTTDLAVPHIGWNGVKLRKASPFFNSLSGQEKFYFVHSYHVVPDDETVILTTTDYGHEFVSAVQKDHIIGTQYHPEKSGDAGLRLLKNFLAGSPLPAVQVQRNSGTRLAKRIIACLDVRADDRNDLVVTKGDQYDVREGGQVRNLGKPVTLARRYYEEGADEITFLNITGFRDFPLKDLPMLEVLRQTSRHVFVPLTIGGGIRDYTDANGRTYSALTVAEAYFRSGADKISIGSDAVKVVEDYLKTGAATGTSAIEEISRVYGSQAVVISIDPRRVYVDSPDDVPHQVMPTMLPGPNGESYCWYQCTVKGGREGRPVDAITLAQVCQQLGAGEILLNCIDRDGTKSGFDLELIREVKQAVTIPVIASSGAGSVDHFLEVFTRTAAEAALAAGIFHRQEVPIQAVKSHLTGKVEIRV
ncbi:MAG: imidazole glycerol phosphate synthase subunit HisF [Desulfatitalea sp.]|nr:imidazole glycerol phosphate synthase subunit HisF [Desulfatitalea sp.]NNK02778.1 imidazole glycerol phosphate synthase subunit HisF [Desulfatitalea sp.]